MSGDGCSATCTSEALEVDIIIDNADGNPAFSTSGTWTSATTTAGFWDTNYAHSGYNNSSKTARWSPNMPVSGAYDVYMWYTAATNRPTAAPVTISYDTGCTQNLTVNQEINGGRWNRLGTFDFSDTLDGYVQIKGAGDGYTIADAVRFVRVGDLGIGSSCP